MSDAGYRFGQVVWRELMSSDPGKSEAYGGLFGWTFADSGMPDMKYTLVSHAGVQIAGLMGVPHEGMPSGWLSYVSVPDVDASAAACTSGGGEVCWGPLDIPGVGRMATLRDDQGAELAVMRGLTGDGPGHERPPVGTFCWESLSTPDADRAVRYYGAVVGWRLMDGPMKVFAAGETMLADIGPAEEGQRASWITHIAVSDIDASFARATELGASVAVPPTPIPGVGRFSILIDPTGATFSLFEAAAQG